MAFREKRSKPYRLPERQPDAQPERREERPAKPVKTPKRERVPA